MNTIQIALICACILYGIVLFLLALKTGKPMKHLGLLALIGLVALAVVDLTRPLTGVYIPVNPWTVGASAAGGLPAVIGIIALRMIFSL